MIKKASVIIQQRISGLQPVIWKVIISKEVDDENYNVNQHLKEASERTIKKILRERKDINDIDLSFKIIDYFDIQELHKSHFKKE